MLEPCFHCGVFHEGSTGCPGELKATGAELRSWELIVDTPNGLQAFAVFIAPTGTLWRARLVSYPPTVWKSVPKGMPRFAGTGYSEVLRLAVAFVEAHCTERGHTGRYAVVHPRSARHTERKARMLPVRYGRSAPIRRASTVNVSPEGLFIETESPCESGEALHLHVDLEGEPAEMHGLVVWSRSGPQPGRPPGMGIRLVAPPSRYRDFVHNLR